MTLERLANHLRYLGYRVTIAWYHDTDVNADMLIVGHPYTNEGTVLMVTKNGRLLNPDEAPSIAKLSHNYGLGITNSGYLFPLNDIEGSVKEFLDKGILQKLDAVVAFHGEKVYLLPADMADAVPPQVSVKQVLAYEEPAKAAYYIMVYGPQLYRPMMFVKKAKNLYVRVNGNKPEHVLADLWQKLLNGEQ